jgi:hypothetical protein
MESGKRNSHLSLAKAQSFGIFDEFAAKEDAHGIGRLSEAPFDPAYFG